jgi:hypothetical protein
MGRLTLNVLLSFAQFEREVTGERIRDKIAASKRKGMWMGGLVPLGYDVRDRHLAVNETEAATVREIFRRYQELGSVRLLKAELDRGGLRSKVRVARNGSQSGGQTFYRGALYTVLRNPIYIGQIRHKGICHPGEHEAIVARDAWDKTQTLLSAHRVRGAARAIKSAPSPLAGKLFDELGTRLTPSHAVKGARRYRYYVSRQLIHGTADHAPRGWRLPAAEIERIIVVAARQMLDDQKALLNAIQEMGIAANRIQVILHSASSWSGRLRSEAESGTVLSALIERVELGQEGFRLTLNLPIQLAESPALGNPTSLAITRFIPLHIKRRGLELRLVIDGKGGRARRADPVLLKAVARAHQWFADLVSGRVSSMVELAAHEQVDERYMSRVLRLSALSPEVVESIVEGRQPPDLTLQMLLTRQIDLPLDWAAQQRVFGVAARSVVDNSTV